MTILLFLGGLALLVGGAELLVRGAATLAQRLGFSSLVVGLTVVAFGTSAPEMAVSVKASIMNQADLALGNVVGSNIFNVLFILGVSALITPLAVQRQLVRLDVPIMIVVSVLCWLLVTDGVFGRLEGAVFFAGILAYTAMVVVMAMRDSRGKAIAEGAPPRTAKGFAWDLLLAAAGLVILIIGSRWLLTSSVAIARTLGVSELVIGLTIVAAGTSLPEVATSIMAAIRDERDIAVGNVVGSNIFNLLAVLGASAMVSESGVAVAASAFALDIPVMVLVALACLPVFFTGLSISRAEGALFLAAYGAYTALLILDATNSEMAPLVGKILLYVFVPAAAIALISTSVMEWRRPASLADAGSEFKS